MKKLAHTLLWTCAAALAWPASATDAPGTPSVRSAADGSRLAARSRGKKPPPPKADPKPVAPEEKRPPSDPRAAAVEDAGGGGGGGAVDPGARRGMSRIEFDDRLIQGQTNKANAIYLFERRESALRSLLKKRTDFRQEIDETLEQ